MATPLFFESILDTNTLKRLKKMITSRNVPPPLFLDSCEIETLSESTILATGYQPDLPPLAILKNMQMFVSQITWWMPHVFVWRSPKRSKMSASAYNVPHTKYMWTSTWPGLAGFGVLSADSVHARPPYSTCRPGHLPRGSVPPGVPDETVLLSKAPGGSPYILYGR